MSGRLAAVIAVGALGIISALGLAGQGGDDQRDARVELGATGAPIARPTAERAPATIDGALPDPYCPKVAPTAETPLPDMAGALPGDDGNAPIPLGQVLTVPNEDRLDFLFEGRGCFLDAHFIDPENPRLGSGVWTAGRPFHVREGFINNGVEPLGEGFGVTLYVTRMETGRVEPTYRYTPDYVLRGTADRCGPTYRSQSGPQTCEWFVHDFPEGLPQGRFAIWAVWEAPCSAWVDLVPAGSCAEPDRVVSLFSSGFDAPYRDSGPDYSATSVY